MLPLLRLELKRQLPLLIRLLSVATLGCGLLYIMSKPEAGKLLAIAAGMSFGAVMLVPMGVVRDRHEGTLEFLSRLPIQPTALAASRIAAVAIVSLPFAILVGLASLGLSAASGATPLTIFVVAWIVVIAPGAVLTALFVRFSLEDVFVWPMAVFLAGVYAIPRYIRWLAPDFTAVTFLHWLEDPRSLCILLAVLIAFFCTYGWVSFRLAASGFERLGSGTLG
jgi:hypothetical protein